MQMQDVELTRIAIRKDNGNRTADIGSLAESIAAIGLIQPIIIRSLPEKKGGTEVEFEIIAGHRRYAAVQKLEQKSIRCVILSADDRSAQAMRIAENIHRLPLTPLQEAEAIAKLRKLGRSTPEIAADLAMRPQYIARRERLLSLIPEWLKRWQKSSGDEDRPLQVGAMELIAAQEQSVQKELLRIFGHYNPDLDDLKHRLSKLNNLLSSAPWDLSDALLLPAAGACKDCPKRSSCQPLLFQDEVEAKKSTVGDKCLDPGCWDKKREIYFKARIKEAQEKYGNLIYVEAKGYSPGSSIELPKDTKILASHNYEIVKKDDPGAKAAMLTDGGNAGKVIWIKSTKSKSPTAGPNRPKLNAQEDRQARRAKLIINKIQDIIRDRETVPEPLTKLSDANKLRLLASILLHCDMRSEKENWPNIKRFEQCKPEVALKELWDKVRMEIHLPVHPFADAFAWIKLVRPFAETVLGLNWAELEAEALKAVPDVKPKAGAAKNGKPTGKKKVAKTAHRSCRICGCTNTTPCHDPESGNSCYWIEDDLCSACSEKAQTYPGSLKTKASKSGKKEKTAKRGKKGKK